MKNNFISLIDNVPLSDDAARFISYCDLTLTASFEKNASRIITDVILQDVDDKEKAYKASKALWDTGSSISCISKRMADMMKLKHDDIGACFTPTGQMDLFYYRVNVRLSDEIVIPNVKVACYPLEKHDVDFLIGMDIISKGNFSVRHDKENMIMEFESCL